MDQSNTRLVSIRGDCMIKASSWPQPHSGVDWHTAQHLLFL